MANETRCVIVAASPVSEDEFIASCISPTDFIICADGGADKLSRIGIVPNMIIGDFDSVQQVPNGKDIISEGLSASEAPSVSGCSTAPRVIALPTDKDDTDTMFCVRTAVELGFREILILGGLGGRLDHTLANLSVLLWLSKHGAHGILSDSYSDTFLLSSGENKLYGKCGTTVSIMPFACESVTLTYSGMKYPLNHTQVETLYPYTVSNVVVSDEATVTVHSGTALAVVERCGK